MLLIEKIMKIALFISIICLFISQPLRVLSAVKYKFISCMPDYSNYTKGSLYHENLNLLLSRLSSQASHVVFHNSTVGGGQNKAYGLFHCREDLDLDVCTECVEDAAKTIVQKCLYFFEAIVWYEECMLRYAKREIFSLHEVHPTASTHSPSNVTNYLEFGPIFKKTMDKLISDAAFSTPSKYFATREANVTSYTKLYGLAQCTPDLDGFGCNYCLKNALVYLNSCCAQSISSVVFFPSCQLVYAMSPFYRVPASSPLTTANHQDKTPIEPAIIATITVAASVGLGLLLIGVWLIVHRNRTRNKSLSSDGTDNEDNLDDTDFLQYDFASMDAATGGFSDANKLGEGGFGIVYKGTLQNGQQVAIKRLSENSGQGAKEFITEARIVARLQHKNLVKLLGSCSEEEEKLLVYEFMPNKSLDGFLFDPSKRMLLSWNTRYKIITGIAKGLQYLHKDSRLTIVHRDLKTSNILLDNKLKPKVADFGLAKVFGAEESLGNTTRIAGTCGYMASEYVFTGEYSEKSDVYSFGIIVMEILSGQHNRTFYKPSDAKNLPIHTWMLWNEGRSFELVDITLRGDYAEVEVKRCIQIGILCVQENAIDRPTMAEVLLMLSGSIDLPVPLAPAEFFHGLTMPLDYNGVDDSGSPNKHRHDNFPYLQTTHKPPNLGIEDEEDLYPIHENLRV